MNSEFLTGIILHPALRRKFLPASFVLKEFRSSPNGKGCGARNESDSEFIQTKLLPEVFSSISRLNSSEFDKLIEVLLTFSFVDWEKEQCFISIRILGQIFGYISSLAPEPLVNEFLSIFSKHDAPPQVKYYLLPEVVKHLKQPLKEVVTDKTLYHLIYFMRMKNSLSSAAVAAADAKVIHSFWLQLQYTWTDIVAASLLPVFVQMVDILPNLSLETLVDVRKAMAMQFTDEEDEVPILTLLSVSILLLGFRQFDYSVQGTEWEDIAKIISSVVKATCRRGVFDPSASTKELRYFIVRILSNFLSVVALEDEEMLKDAISSVPVPAIRRPTPDVGVPKEISVLLSRGTITQHLDEVEQLVEKIKGYHHDVGLSTAEKARILRGATQLERLCH